MRARAWCRVDLAGGTLDIWPLGLLHPGARTVNLAVDCPVEVAIERSDGVWRIEQGSAVSESRSLTEMAATGAAALPALVLRQLGAPPVRVRIRSTSPRGGGLGASSSLVVALIAAIGRLAGSAPLTPEKHVGLGRDLEARLMGLPTGVQDHWPALLGGVLDIRHEPGGTVVRRLDVDLEALGERLVVAFSGVSHFSAGNNWQVVRRRLDGDPETIDRFRELAAVATEMADAVAAGDLERAGGLIAREWRTRSCLAPAVSTPQLEEQLEAARRAGAWGGKACGAGGGGCVAVLCPSRRRRAVEAALAATGAEVLPFRPVAGGLLIEGA